MSDDAEVSLSVIIAAMNEEAAIESVTRETVDRLATRLLEYEIILVDDGSTDRTGQLMDAMAAAHDRVRVIHNPRNLGLGNVYRIGVAAARHRYVMMLCGDGGLPPASLPAILEKVGTADIVIPYMTNLREIKTGPRYLLSRTYTGLMNWISGLRLNYYNGLPVHRRELVRALEIASTGFAFQAEILIKLIRAGHSYVEIGVHGGSGKPSRAALRISNVISVLRTLALLIRSVVRDTRALPPAQPTTRT